MPDSKLFGIATFNANSVRARLHIIIPWLKNTNIDVLCLQETKVVDKDFPEEEFKKIGYETVYRGQKSYNGVAIVSRHAIKDVSFGFDDEENSEEDSARLIRCRVASLPIINTYVPQGRAIDHENYQKKLLWFKRLGELFQRNYSPQEPLLWCGDMNVAPEPIDVHKPEKLKNHVCYHKDAREAFSKVKEWGFHDLLRKFHPEPEIYTFFDYRVPQAVKRKIGWRIDHLLATSPLVERCKKCYVDLEPRMREKPSDHTFLVGLFAWP